MSVSVLVRDSPSRAIALQTDHHVLIFTPNNGGGQRSGNGSRNGSSIHLGAPTDADVPRCMVEFAPARGVDLSAYRPAGARRVHGTLGLIALGGDVFLCVVSGNSPRVAGVRPGETVTRIEAVEFHCVSGSAWDGVLGEGVNRYPTEDVDEEGFDGREGAIEHPCLALKKLLSSGSFYYSADFDVTRRLQKRLNDDETTIAIDSLDAGFLWNSFMIQPLVDFRSRLSRNEKAALDASGMLTSAIRGFCQEMIVPASSDPFNETGYGDPAHLTLISRLSCRRAGTRFNSRGIDDDGNVANYVESETIFWSPCGQKGGTCFSYVQVRGSVPVFWEQQTALLPGQQKPTPTRSVEATQPAFDKHFENLEHSYDAVHVVNLLSKEGNKPGEIELTKRFEQHISRSALNGKESLGASEHQLLKYTDYDFHAETRGPGGYVAASGIMDLIQDSMRAFGYLYAHDVEEFDKSGTSVMRKAIPERIQTGVFRTNCLDCLDRTNLIQTIISIFALEMFLHDLRIHVTPDFRARHDTLWADNGDALSRIYAGTGALKSSFTRHGKMSLGGLLADARKSATRMYINNFADKGRQNTIDMLLGRLMGQVAVHLYDPINDWVQMELRRRASEFSSTQSIRVFVGTFNLNGKTTGINSDLRPWLCPDVAFSQQNPEVVAIGFQEIVELSPQQIMSEDPARRQAWEQAVKRTLNDHAAEKGDEEYVLLRGVQLVGASLSVFVKASVLPYIKNVEGAIKKTGLSGMAGNKGAVAIRMDYCNTSLCFVTAHLAAGFANYDERHRDYRTISSGLRFLRNRTIDAHDTVIWFGDFNYRIGLSNEKVRKLIEHGNYDELLANDQLHLAMTHAAGTGVFSHYDEARITFPPTYKFDLGTDNYDSSEKSRIPAWCDRVLRKGLNVRQANYNTAPLKFSDHRPVYATFHVEVSMVDEKHRDALSAQLYAQRKADVGGRSPALTADPTDEEDLLDFDPPANHPAAPSTSNRKWWLDNGLPAHTTLRSPTNHAPNPARPANPFVPSDEPDWVRVERITPSPPGPYDGSFHGLPPPLVPSPAPSASSVPRLPPRRQDTGGSVSGSSILPASSARSSVASAQAAVVKRKAAPPVPKKPSTLAHAASLPDLAELNLKDAPVVPPPRRAGTGVGNIAANGNGNGVGAPALPPRKAVRGGLMDEADEEGMMGLSGWEVLKPGPG
ncbi:hypothetical protein EJ06DRAFT_486446 [Trichodelitschia bisporula]|uniref:phosphoinositide 5-phosphatase n=1 Tax=Trichodelitschia bisporula TaxID=703511 RepID=A0A6G1IB93_9PEZI|nr:hypothetical protein EJ06DRAFT_486446 [Trichodelitschia bisporula]